MKIEDLRKEIETKTGEVRSLLDEKKVEEGKKAMEELRGLKETLKIQEELEQAEERDLKEQAKKVEERKIEDKKEGVEMDNNKELRSIFNAETRAMNTKKNEQGGYVINDELSHEIIKTLKDRSNVYKFFNGTNINGTLRIPKKASSGKAEWMDESTVPMSNISATEPTLGMIDLGQHRLYRESAITQQMLNVQELDLKAFILDDINESMTDSIEDAIFNGAGDKQPEGLISGITKKITLDKNDLVSALKQCKFALKKAYWGQAKWFMNNETMLALDLLKDVNGRPLLCQDLTVGTGYKLLGLDVEITDAMASCNEAGKCCIVLATPAAYHTNTQKTVAMHVYDDSAYTRAGLLGYACDIYMDGKVKNDDCLAGIFTNNTKATK